MCLPPKLAGLTREVVVEPCLGYLEVAGGVVEPCLGYLAAAGGGLAYLAKADVLASNLGWRREGGSRGALPRLLGGRREAIL